MLQKPATSGRIPLIATVALLLLGLSLPRHVAGQRERQIEAPSENERKFFDQLRSLFGRFRDEDLRRAFRNARPIECEDLISDTGEWRTVAFFNEDRRLGDWYFRSLDEVKADFSGFIFKGTCTAKDSSVQLVTKFPVSESVDRYAAGRISRKEVQVNVNAPVTASFDRRTQAYRFELPYLYSALRNNNRELVYTLYAPKTGDRYATNVTNLWDCKSVDGNDVTFQFLICETATLPRAQRRESVREQAFGAYAYFILSDGKEATTTTRLSFGVPGDEENKPVATEAGPSPEPAPDRVQTGAPGREGWQVPGPAARLAEVDRNEFRIRFSPQTWAGKADSAQILSDQKMSVLDPGKLPTGIDYCTWQPATASFVSRLVSNEPDAEVAFALTTTDGDRSSPARIKFEMKTLTGSRIGSIECVFPRTESAASILFDRWVSIVGGHIILEINP
jgi:hypothetical protein